MAWLAASNAGMRSQVADDAEQLREALALGEALHDPRLMVWSGLAAMNLGDLEAMQSCYSRALELARAAGAAGSMPYVLELASLSLALAGKYVSAKTASEEGLRLARETEQQRSAGQLLAILSFVAATKGDEAETRRLADEAREISVPLGIGLTNATVTWSLARLDLGLGRYDLAVDRLARLASAEPGAGHPIIALWSTADLLEAAARARRTADVADHVAWAVGVTGGRGAGAATVAAWYRGLLGGPDAADQLLAAADGLGELGFPLAQARALLSLGELLRRERRPRAAREHLRAAQETFHALGATVWAERAAAELRASGDTGQPLEANGLEKLTAQELQIVRYVSQGASNRDIAAQLFISPRTVEYHLYKAYPKLGISSRTQLISQLSGALAAAGPG
jgi:DNA-binding CsgD family transcriptional regulator